MENEYIPVAIRDLNSVKILTPDYETMMNLLSDVFGEITDDKDHQFCGKWSK